MVRLCGEMARLVFFVGHYGATLAYVFFGRCACPTISAALIVFANGATPEAETFALKAVGSKHIVTVPTEGDSALVIKIAIPAFVSVVIMGANAVPSTNAAIRAARSMGTIRTATTAATIVFLKVVLAESNSAALDSSSLAEFTGG